MNLRLLIVVAVAGCLTPLAGGAEPMTRPAFASGLVEKDGLQVSMIGHKTAFARNDAIRFTVRFKNVSDKPVSLQDADVFQHWVVRLEEVTSKMPWRLQDESDEPGPIHQPRILMPGESVDVSTEWGTNRFPFRYESELILNMPIPATDSLRPGRYQLWLGINLKRDAGREGAQLSFRGDINVGPVEVEILDKDDPSGVQASEALKENGAEFTALTKTRWAVPAPGAESEVHLGLKVSNVGGRWMQINTFDTVQVVLEDSLGKELSCIHARDATRVPEPLVLQAREGRTLYRNAVLRWPQDGKGLRLSGPDGAGGEWRFDDVKPGKYTVRLVYTSNEEALKPVLDRPAQHAINPKEAPFWTGKVTTRGLVVEVVEGLVAPDGRPLGVRCRNREDAIKVAAEGGGTILSVTSPSGIGAATVERGGGRWPDELILRIHLRGLESLRLSGGGAALGISVLSHGGNTRLLHLAGRGEGEGPQLTPGDPGWTDVRAVDARGQPVAGLPGEGGWFELTVPKVLLPPVEDTLRLDWVDFYR